MAHQDFPVYQITALRTPRSDPGHAGLWQGVALLTQHAAQTEQRRFATLGRDLLLSQGGFSTIDRVCLARQIAGSNQLEVIDAFSTARVGNSRMVPGYRCIVDPQGSLMRLAPGQLRTFQDAATVVQSYARSERPVQRSIGLIAGMGLHSGLCLPVWSSGRRLGFLFVNTVELGAFDNISDTQCGLLTLLLQSATSELAGLHGDNMPPGTATLVSGQGLAQELSERFSRIAGASIRIQGSGEPHCFGVLPHLVQVALVALASRWDGSSELDLQLAAEIVGEELIWICSGVPNTRFGLSQMHLQQSDRLAALAGMRLEHGDNHFRIIQAADQATPDIPYST